MPRILENYIDQLGFQIGSYVRQQKILEIDL